jgi:hypothetical protein
MESTWTMKPGAACKALLMSTCALNATSLAGNLITALSEHGYLKNDTLISKAIINYITPYTSTYREGNIATYFNSMILLIAAMLCLAIWKSTSHSSGRKKQGGWLAIAVIFLLMSIDEVSMLHENSGYIAEYILEHVSGASSPIHWWYPVLLVVAVGALKMAPFLASLPARTRGLLILAGGIYIFGAVGLEAVGHYILDHSETIAIGEGRYSFILSYSIEEFLEMIGINIAILGAMLYMAESKVAINFRSRAEAVNSDLSRPQGWHPLAGTDQSMNHAFFSIRNTGDPF